MAGGSSQFFLEGIAVYHRVLSDELALYYQLTLVYCMQAPPYLRAALTARWLVRLSTGSLSPVRGSNPG